MTLDESVKVLGLCRSLNGILPDSIAIRAITAVQDSFHARYDAIRRTYRYQVHCSPIALGREYSWHVMPAPDFQLMNNAAVDLLGEHNYSSFCRSASETVNRVCNVSSAKWTRGDREGDWVFLISANRFLHGMVRSIVGTLIEIGRGKRPGDTLPKILQEQNREAAGYAAPAKGLTLVRVDYPS